MPRVRTKFRPDLVIDMDEGEYRMLDRDGLIHSVEEPEPAPPRPSPAPRSDAAEVDGGGGSV